jgi:hypothetical protein
MYNNPAIDETEHHSRFNPSLQKKTWNQTSRQASDTARIVRTVPLNAICTAELARDKTHL